MQNAYIKPTPSQIISWIEANISSKKIRHSPKRGDIYLIDNPAIPGDSGYHVGICPDEGWVNDYRSQMSEYNGSFLRFVSKIRNYSIQEAIKEVCGKNINIRTLLAARANRSPVPVIDESNDIIKLPDGLLHISDNSFPKARDAVINYLMNRAVSLDEALKHQVYYSAARVCFPYIEYGELVYWQARMITTKQYLFPPDAGGKTAGDFLHGFDHIEPGGIVILVESIFNELSIGDNTLATGGATLKEKQYRRIRDVLEPSKIILAPDNDEAGIGSIIKNYKLLSQSFKDIVYYCIPPDPYKDWNDMAVAMGRLKNINVISDYVLANAKKVTLAQLMKLQMG